jgi:hypothetical protein
MCFEIKLEWIESKMPMLKEVDVNRLSAIKKPKSDRGASRKKEETK